MFRTVRTAALLLLLFSAAPAFSADELSDKALLLKKADEALARSDRKTADFYAARYLGVCAREDAAACPAETLELFIKKRRFEPKGFLPEGWDPAFIKWFEQSVRERWGVPSDRVREKARSFEITQNTYKDKYFVTVAAYPELEQWYVLKDGLISKPILLAMGAFRDHPTLFFGRTLKGTATQSSPTFLDTQKRKLHYLWKPEFFDVDGDGTPEVWVRFNLAWGNGFSQVLEVYKIRESGKLELFHHFQGEPNGHAYRLENGSVEIGGVPRSSPNLYHHETWVFKNKEFKKSAQKDVPLSKKQDFPFVISRT